MKPLLTLLLVTVLAAATAFGLARWFRARPAEWHETDWLRRELKLSEAQAAEVATLEAEFQQRLSAICAAHCAARADLAESLHDPTKAAEACRRMCAAQTDSEQAVLDHFFRVRALLTPDQQKRHLALVQQQLAGSCTMRVQPARNRKESP